MASVLDVLQKSKKSLVSELTKSDITSHCADEKCVKEVTEIVKKLNVAFKDRFKDFMRFDGGGGDYAGGGLINGTFDNLLQSDTLDKKALQEAARHHVLAASPAQQLLVLQGLQNSMPPEKAFVLADPLRRFYSGGGAPNYGPQDLYYFISDHFAKEMKTAKNTGQDPFYQPIAYPDDASIDTVLQQLIVESPYQKFLRLYDQYKNMKDAPQMHADRLKQIYRILTDPTHVSNPWYMTKFINGQERPMDTYRNKEFTATLSQFANEYASTPKPKITKITQEVQEQ
jgi:hypothetical protein